MIHTSEDDAAASTVPVWRRTSPHTASLTAENPGGMTLEGTNTYVVGRLGERFPVEGAAPSLVVVDPGPEDAAHVRSLAAAGSIEMILVTHRHADHYGSARALHELTGAPVRTWDETLCLGGPPLTDGEVVSVDGVEILVLHTPGHTADSVCLRVEEDNVMLTGDTVLGQGSTMLDFPDGSLEDYLDSLRELQEFPPSEVLPAHGPAGADLDRACEALLGRRIDRVREIRQALKDAEDDLAPSAEALTRRFYGDVPEDVRPSATKTIKAQLAYLMDLGEIAGFTD